MTSGPDHPPPSRMQRQVQSLFLRMTFGPDLHSHSQALRPHQPQTHFLQMTFGPAHRNPQRLRISCQGEVQHSHNHSRAALLACLRERLFRMRAHSGLTAAGRSAVAAVPAPPQAGLVLAEGAGQSPRSDHGLLVLISLSPQVGWGMTHQNLMRHVVASAVRREIRGHLEMVGAWRQMARLPMVQAVGKTVGILDVAGMQVRHCRMTRLGGLPAVGSVQMQEPVGQAAGTLAHPMTHHPFLTLQQAAHFPAQQDGPQTLNPSPLTRTLGHS